MESDRELNESARDRIRAQQEESLKHHCRFSTTPCTCGERDAELARLRADQERWREDRAELESCRERDAVSGETIRELSADNRSLRAENERLQVDAHGLALVEAVIGRRGMTDHSTPVHIRVQNVLAEADHAAALQASRDEALARAEKAERERDEARPHD